MTAVAIADRLNDALPDAGVFAGTDLDRFAVAGVRPQAAVRPRSAEQVAALLRLAGEHGWAVAPVGGGTMLDLGNPPARLDLAIDLSALDAVVDYQPDDLTLTVQAGISVARIGRLLAEHGQMLPLDVPLPERATIGGALACDASGPLALRFGTARDLVIGMQAALPVHGLARSGGKVVKNVAGYDLAKLHIGGLGTLGVITEVTFKLWPALAAASTVVATFVAPRAALAVGQQLLRGQLFPAAIELLDPVAASRVAPDSHAGPWEAQWLLVVHLLGSAAAVERQTHDVQALCSEAGATVVTALSAETGDRVLAGIRDLSWDADAQERSVVRASVLPSETGVAIAALQRLARAVGQPPALLARPGRGSARAVWDGLQSAGDVAQAVLVARRELAELHGDLTIERAPAGALRGLDAWGLDGPDLALMRRLKQAYDPQQLLNPGRYVGGI
jgi:glycolate oxidase FAD binding subunit